MIAPLARRLRPGRAIHLHALAPLERAAGGCLIGGRRVIGRRALGRRRVHRLVRQRLRARRRRGYDLAVDDDAGGTVGGPPPLPADSVGALDAAHDDALVQHLGARGAGHEHGEQQGACPTSHHAHHTLCCYNLSSMVADPSKAHLDPSKAHLELLEALGHAVPRSLDIPRARRIFVNRNLRMDDIDLIGFDMDYTLAIYHQRALEALVDPCTLDKLIAKRGYPEEIRALDYDPAFVMRGLVVDRALRQHLQDRSLRPRRPRLPRPHRHVARGAPPPLPAGAHPPVATRYAWIDTLFALPEACLYAEIDRAASSAGGRQASTTASSTRTSASASTRCTATSR